jgi:menaquinone-dependent protoporphyrinogen oxidase
VEVAAMSPILVLYATREGHTRRIAEHVAATLRSRGKSAEAREVSTFVGPLSPEVFDSAVLAASIHLGKHEPEMVSFVKVHRDELACLPTAFLSVSLAEATVEDEARPEALRAEADRDVHKALDTFFEETGWHPARTKPVAGALLFKNYGVVLRFVMKLIAKKAGLATDTSRNDVYTNWKALDRVLDEVADPRAPQASRIAS